MVQFERDRRVLKDRRQKPTNPLGGRMFSARRQSIRRKTDRKAHFYVDRYGHRLLIALLIIILLSILDAYFTIFHVEKGAREINPFMDFLIGYGNIYFFAAKYILTALGVFLLCIYKNLLFVRIIIGSLMFFYFIVFSHHILLTFLK